MKSLLIAVAAAASLWSLPVSADELTVSAASSLSDAFSEIGKAYENAHLGTQVLFNYGSSGSLLQQLVLGAPVAVFATADLETMDRAQRRQLIVPATRVNFASNRLVVILPSDSHLAVSALADLAGEGFNRIAIGVPDSVPAGRYAKHALELAGQWEKLKSKYVFGQNVRQVLDYVARGEVDAGLVYSTDAALMRGRVRVALQVKLEEPIVYPIAAVQGSGKVRPARAFIAFVRSPAAREILSRYGFGQP